MSALPLVLLFAAHADDELLGAFEVLVGDADVLPPAEPSRVRVVYPLVMNAARGEEARSLAAALGYEVRFAGEPPRDAGEEVARVYLPSPTDRHADHQRALTAGLAFVVEAGLDDALLWEYSVEKRASYVRPHTEAEVAQKRALWMRHYPSQHGQLLDPNRYLLFGGTAPLAPPSLTVRFQQHGFHRWADAPDEVAYLRDLHRHLFHVALTLHDVAHHDRAMEFHLVQEWAKWVFHELHHRAGTDGASCETMARFVAVMARVKYGVRCTVSVTEDGENGAEVTV